MSNKYWPISGLELEEHLTTECGLTIQKEIRMQAFDYLTATEQELLAQFPPDEQGTPYFDEVLLEPLTNECAEEDLLYTATVNHYTVIGEPFRTARFWCLRVTYV